MVECEKSKDGLHHFKKIKKIPGHQNISHLTHTCYECITCQEKSCTNSVIGHKLPDGNPTQTQLAENIAKRQIFPSTK